MVAMSETGFLLLKIAGCVVLAWLAYRSFRSWSQLRREPDTAADVPAAVPAGPVTLRRALAAVAEGFVVQLASPKAAVFLLALYPQFVPPGRPLFQTTTLLGVLQVTVETILYVGVALAVHRAGGWFRRSVVRRRLEAVTGTVLVTLGSGSPPVTASCVDPPGHVRRPRCRPLFPSAAVGVGPPRGRARGRSPRAAAGRPGLEQLGSTRPLGEHVGRGDRPHGAHGGRTRRAACRTYPSGRGGRPLGRAGRNPSVTGGRRGPPGIAAATA